jgi:hypothetical protein
MTMTLARKMMLAATELVQVARQRFVMMEMFAQMIPVTQAEVAHICPATTERLAPLPIPTNVKHIPVAQEHAEARLSVLPIKNAMHPMAFVSIV